MEDKGTKNIKYYNSNYKQVNGIRDSKLQLFINVWKHRQGKCVEIVSHTQTSAIRKKYSTSSNWEKFGKYEKTVHSRL